MDVGSAENAGAIFCRYNKLNSYFECLLKIDSEQSPILKASVLLPNKPNCFDNFF